MNVEQIYSFIELSWGDKYKLVAKALDEKYGEFMAQVVDFYDDYVVSWVCSQDCKTTTLLKINYSINAEGALTLSEGLPVHVIYEPLPKSESALIVDEEEEEEEDDQEDREHQEQVLEAAPVMVKTEEEIKKEEEEEKRKQEDYEEKKKNKNCDISEDLTVTTIQINPSDVATTSTVAVGVDESKTSILEVTKIIEAASVAENKDVKKNDEQVKKDSADIAALAESQLKELAAYRFKEKVDCINGYANTLPNSMIAEYIVKAETLTLAELKVQLNEEFRKFAPRTRKINSTFLSLSRESDTTKAPSIKELVEKYK